MKEADSCHDEEQRRYLEENKDRKTKPLFKDRCPLQKNATYFYNKGSSVVTILLFLTLICPIHRFAVSPPPPFYFGCAVPLAGSWFPDQRLNPGPAVKALSPSHWPTRELPHPLIC